MSYSTIHACAHDLAFQNRIEAACAQEGEPNPTMSMNATVYPISATADVEAAYASALAGENPDPGGDESVITDAMILSHLQPLLPVDLNIPPAPTGAP